MVRPSLGEDARDVAWRFLVATGSGALVGVAAGVVLRLVMLVLRIASPELVIGVQSDDGFEIGLVSTATLFLLMVCGGLGGVGGVFYLAVRQALPGWSRAACFGVVVGLVTGADIVNPDGVDFTLLDPKLFAIVAFTVVPGVAAAAIALLVERLLLVEPWTRRGLAVVLGLASLVLTGVLAAVGVLAGLALLLRRRPRVAAGLLGVGRVVVPVAAVVVAARAGVELWRDAGEIL